MITESGEKSLNYNMSTQIKVQNFHDVMAQLEGWNCLYSGLMILSEVREIFESTPH